MKRNTKRWTFAMKRKGILFCHQVNGVITKWRISSKRRFRLVFRNTIAPIARHLLHCFKWSGRQYGNHVGSSFYRRVHRTIQQYRSLNMYKRKEMFFWFHYIDHSPKLHTAIIEEKFQWEKLWGSKNTSDWSVIRYCHGLVIVFQKGPFLLKVIQRHAVNGPFILRCLILLHSCNFSELAECNHGTDKDCIGKVKLCATLWNGTRLKEGKDRFIGLKQNLNRG